MFFSNLFEFRSSPLDEFIINKVSENMQKTHRRTSELKCDFNKVGGNFIEIALRHGCSPLSLLHIFRIPFPKNTWKAASVSWQINFEKWEKIRLDHDENVNITYFFAKEQAIIIKISQATWKKVDYFNSSQLSSHDNLDLSISLKKNKTNH